MKNKRLSLVGFSKSEMYTINEAISKRAERIERLSKLHRRDSRTAFDYSVVTDSLRKEFLEAVDFFMGEGRKNLSGYDTWYSSRKNFYVTEEYLKISYRFYTDRESCSPDGYYLLYDTTRVIKSYAFDNYNDYLTKDDCRDVFNRYRTIFHQYLTDSKWTDMGFDTVKRHFNNGNDIHYDKARVFDNELHEILERVMDGTTVPKYAHPKEYSDVTYDAENNKLSFYFNGRETVMKIGKGIKRILKHFGIEANDEQIKTIVQRVTASTEDYELVVVEGDDIDYYYHEDRYDTTMDTATLEGSCMRYRKCIDGDFFRVYKDNCKMIILKHKVEDVIIGRAILWKADNMDDGETVNVMDRIYGAEKNYTIFKDWAKANNYWTKRYQSYDNEWEFVSPTTGDSERLNLSVNICLDDYGNVPYMDTFAWGDDSVVRNDEGYGCYSARDTDGELSGRNYNDDDGEKW